jgi:hypothetical protein
MTFAAASFDAAAFFFGVQMVGSPRVFHHL